MPEIIIYSSAVCGYCVAAKNLLKSRGLGYREIRIDIDPAARALMMERARRTSVPQIFINGTHVGGYEELVALDRSGGLAPLVVAAP